MEAEKMIQAQTKSGVGRRGVIAGAAALAAALIAKQASVPVEATDGVAPLVGQNNTYTATTTLTSTVATTPSAPGFRVKGTSNVATPDTTNDAVQGFTQQAQNAGLLGRNDDLNGVGAAGIASNGTGVYGQSTSGSALGGQSTSGAGTYSVSTSGYGVFGQSNSNIGGYFLSSGSYGVLAITTAGAPYSGLTGGASVAGAAAFAGGGTNGAYGAYFSGPTVVQGNFTVVSGQKNAAVQHTDGTHRLLHCVEAPEPWFEDFGEGTLAGGKSDVTIDPDFAAVVMTDKYLIYLTSLDAGCKGLAVAGQTAAGFTVQELNGGTSSGGFVWRLVAKRKDLGKVQRLAKFTLPNIKIPGINAPLPAAPNSGPSPLPNRKGTGASGPAPAGPVAPPPAPNPVPVGRTSDVSAPAPAAVGAPPTAPNPLPPSR